MGKILLLILLLPVFIQAQNVNFSKYGSIINSDGTNYVSIDTTNAVRLYGRATTWDDLFVPLTTAKTGTNTFPTFIQDSVYYDFYVDSSGVNKCIMYFVIQLPHRWKEQSKIYPHVHYKHTTGVGTPTYVVYYRWASITGNITSNWAKYVMNITTGTTGNTHQLVSGSGGIDATGKTLSSIMICQLWLRSQTGTGDVPTYQFDIHYEIDALGSKFEYTK